MCGQSWYANEDICRKREFTTTQKFIDTQRKIARRTKANPEIGYFTYEMLCKIRRVGRGTCGEKPDKKIRKK